MGYHYLGANLNTLNDDDILEFRVHQSFYHRLKLLHQLVTLDIAREVL
jgi:hypothetical protein